VSSTRDITVVGAGPSGSWAAYLLAQDGARVRLVDSSHPREKPCGGGITGRALALVAPAVLARPRSAVPIRSARFIDSTRGFSRAVPLEYAVKAALVVASRQEFDEQLLNAARTAGAAYVTARVASVSRVGSGFRVATTDGRSFDSDIVIGADGVNSVVRRDLAAPFRRHQLSIATGFFAHGVTADEIALEMFSNPPGYLWSFPRFDHLAIGVCAQAAPGVTAPALRARAAAWISATGIGAGAHLEPYAWPIPSLEAADFRRLVLGGVNWLLVGDAAGLVDPITREGIFFALQSAEFAADAIQRRRVHDYGARVQDQIAPELAEAARLKAGFFRPEFNILVMDALERSAPIRRVMADLVAGVQPYRALKWRLLKTLELSLACRFVAAALRQRRQRVLLEQAPG
jgi:geranylgeranyl reductase family protein